MGGREQEGEDGGEGKTRAGWGGGGTIKKEAGGNADYMAGMVREGE